MDIRIPEQNLVLIAGRLTRDPELRFTQKGQGMSSFDVAVNRRYKDLATGEWKDDTVFVPVIVWGQVAERCKEKLKKGSAVHVEGRLAGTEYIDKTGQKRRMMKVNARRVQFLSHTPAEAEGGSPAPEAPDAVEPAESEVKHDVSGMDEVPF
ncbi:MAG TPA: single-stranded DNA-binding protein [Elusimicrobiales bacterium]|nr:single-stranded DNA-binding protein [Elusimicrobiales bacterium]